MRLGAGWQELPSVERGLLHLNADEPGLQQHLLRVDFRDVELLRRALAVEELERTPRMACGCPARSARRR